MSRVRLLRASVAWVIVVLLVPAFVAAHPRHESIAEAEWNRETGKLEVALRLRPEDIESALTRVLRRSKRVNLDSTPDVDEHLQAYLGARFTLHSADSKKRQEFVWIGKEVDLRYAWVYFELTMPAAPEQAVLSSTVLMDLLPDQVNTVLIKDGRRQSSLQFSRLKPRQRPWEKQVKPPVEKEK